MVHIQRVPGRTQAAAGGDSSNFPRFIRNLNTAENPQSGKNGQKATNVVYHDRQHPSAMVVPVVP